MKSYENYFVQPERYIKNIFFKLVASLWYKHFFKQFGKNSLIIRPLKIDNPNNIQIGYNVCINDYAWLCAGQTLGREMNGGRGAIEIENNVHIGHYAHIVGCYRGVRIESNVLIADKVYISDCSHSYANIQEPIVDSCIEALSKVNIGAGSWLGENVVVNGCSVGKHCVIGANSFVNSDIPDYCVAVGQPAKVVKRYNFELNDWLKV